MCWLAALEQRVNSSGITRVRFWHATSHPPFGGWASVTSSSGTVCLEAAESAAGGEAQEEKKKENPPNEKKDEKQKGGGKEDGNGWLLQGDKPGEKKQDEKKPDEKAAEKKSDPKQAGGDGDKGQTSGPPVPGPKPGEQAGDQPGEVRHIDQQISTDIICNLPKSFQLQGAGVGRPACNNQLWPVFTCRLSDLIEVDEARVGPQPV